MNQKGHEHYYSPQTSALSDRRMIHAELRGEDLRFVTDAGVFSKGRIDAGTRLLIDAMPLPVGGNVLDLGCGYGPIGITVAKMCPGCHVYMVDPNERAVNLARENASLNGVTNVTIVRGAGFEPLEGTLPFQAIVTNPPYRAGKEVVYGLVRESFARLASGGTFTCVGQTKQGAKSLKSFIETVFGHVTELAKGGGYRVIHARKQS